MAPKAPVQAVKPASLFDAPAGFFEGAIVYRPDGKGPAKMPADAEQGQTLKLDTLSMGSPETVADSEESANNKSRGEAVDASGEMPEEVPLAQRGMACVACGGVQFTSLVEQRLHFKMDVHRLNVKRRLKSRPPLTEAEFETKMISSQGGSTAGKDGADGSDLSSISGSDTDSSSDDEGDKKGRPKLDDSQLKRKAKLTFALNGGRGERFAIWRSVLLGEKETLDLSPGKSEGDDGAVSEEEALDRLRRLAGAAASTATMAGNNSKTSQGDKGVKAGPSPKQDGEVVASKAPTGPSQGASQIVKTTDRPKGHYWVVLLAGGGHVAGVVMDTVGPEVVAHQTFHRYVVRAKQGGRQSAKDGTGRAPKSGGASLRRYNEAALAKDIRELLGVTWKNYILNASVIFVRASSADARSLYGGESPPLQQGDPRIRSIPLTTRRPTFKEAQRVAQALAFIEWSPPEEIVPERQSALALAPQDVSSEAKQEPVSGRVSPAGTGTKAVGLATLPWVPASPPPPEAVPSTPLHEAALANNADVVKALLEGGANPEARDARGRTPYTLATDKEVRNAFRRFMACHMEAFDWHAADVPSPLTDDMEATQTAKRLEKKAKMKEREKEKRRERRAEEKAKQAEQEAAAAAAAAAKAAKGGRGKGTGSSSGSGSGVTASKVEDREMRAMAAERRLQAMGSGAQLDGGMGKATGGARAGGGTGASVGPHCDCCGVSLSGKTPFYKYSYKYCSTTCIRVHMAQLSGK